MNIGMIGPAAALGLAAVGSALGTGVASQAAIGGWKKCFANNKPAPFMLVAFSGAPLTQTIYGFLLMLFISGSDKDPLTLMSAGIFGGLAMGFSAFFQGKVAARSADALAETGKGTANYFMVIGIVETVALFVMVFLLLML
ncbi:MAG: V-type ATP synthase subunit K [Candidatus Marinimicrobia bacterium]|jgi:V/A-type H+-transporting ATPase subunit K|nr:V-type ATP synthase subunit K [Candidatus Neomarinimicrobiota bacterium]